MPEVLRFARHAFAIAAVGLAMAAPARAGHDERDHPEAVAQKLNSMGFVSWRRIDWHHHFWQVDDARRANGKIYNLRLEAETLDLVRLERQGHY
jgi:hypothetical protein